VIDLLSPGPGQGSGVSLVVSAGTMRDRHVLPHALLDVCGREHVGPHSRPGRTKRSIGIPQDSMTPTDRVSPPPAGSPPAVTVVEISDPAIAGQGIEIVDLDAVQLTTTPFRARRVVVRLEGGAVLYHSTNHRIRTRTKTQRGLLAYVTFDPRAKGTVNGLPIRPELMLAVEPETEVVFVTDAGHESISILLPLEDMRAHLLVRRRVEEFRMPRGVETLQAEAAMVRRLFDWGMRCLDASIRACEARMSGLFFSASSTRSESFSSWAEADAPRRKTIMKNMRVFR